MDEDIRDEALDVLRDAVVWRLAADRWPAVGEIVAALAAGVQAADAMAVRAAVRDLELSGPVRAVRIEDAAVLPAPESVRVRINELVHTLDGGWVHHVGGSGRSAPDAGADAEPAAG